MARVHFQRHFGRSGVRRGLWRLFHLRQRGILRRQSLRRLTARRVYFADDVTAPDKVPSYANIASFLTLLAPADQCYTLDISGPAGFSEAITIRGSGALPLRVLMPQAQWPACSLLRRH